jgi:hypothetical protein
MRSSWQVQIGIQIWRQRTTLSWLLSEDKTKLSFSLEVSSGGKTVRYEDEFPVTLPK